MDEAAVRRMAADRLGTALTGTHQGEEDSQAVSGEESVADMRSSDRHTAVAGSKREADIGHALEVDNPVRDHLLESTLSTIDKAAGLDTAVGHECCEQHYVGLNLEAVASFQEAEAI